MDIEIDASFKDSLASLQAKLGAASEAVVAIAALSAAWNQLAILYSDSEDRHRNNAAGVSALLANIGANMTRLRDQVAADDAELKKLHDDVVGKLSAARADITKAKNVMKEVIDVYNRFQGETSKLKKGIGSLAKSAFTAMNPVVGAFASSWIDKITT